MRAVFNPGVAAGLIGAGVVLIALAIGCHDGSAGSGTASAASASPPSSFHPVSGDKPDNIGVLHDDVHGVTCWYELTCPAFTATGCSSSMSCIADRAFAEPAAKNEDAR
jgi:hypothetical protein